MSSQPAQCVTALGGSKTAKDEIAVQEVGCKAAGGAAMRNEASISAVGMPTHQRKGWQNVAPRSEWCNICYLPQLLIRTGRELGA